MCPCTKKAQLQKKTLKRNLNTFSFPNMKDRFLNGFQMILSYFPTHFCGFGTNRSRMSEGGDYVWYPSSKMAPESSRRGSCWAWRGNVTAVSHSKGAELGVNWTEEGGKRGAKKIIVPEKLSLPQLGPHFQVITKGQYVGLQHEKGKEFVWLKL